MANIALQLMLFPPLHVVNDENPPSADSVDSDVVPSRELRENFDAVRAALSSQHNFVSPNNLTDEQHPPAKNKKRKAPSDGDVRHLAIRTARTAENEISRLMSGIEELESLLPVTELGNSVGVEGVAFPALPPIVPNDPQDSDEQPAVHD